MCRQLVNRGNLARALGGGAQPCKSKTAEPRNHADDTDTELFLSDPCCLCSSAACIGRLFELFIEPLVNLFAHLRRKIVSTIRVADFDSLLLAEQVINLACL